MRRLQKKALLNTVYQIIGKILGIATTFPITLVLASKFGPEVYGDFTKVLNYLAIFFLFGDFGLNAIFLQLANNKSNKSYFWQHLLVLRLMISCGLMIMAALILFILPGGINWGFTPVVKKIILICLPLILWQNLITSANAIFQKDLRYDLASLAIFWGGIVTLFFLWPLSNISLPNSAVLIASLGIFAGSLVNALVALWIVKKNGTSAKIRISFDKLKLLLLPALPLGVTTVIHYFYFRSDALIMTLTRSTYELGIYVLAYKVFEVIIVLPNFFMNTVYSLMVSKKNNYQRIFREALLILSFSSLLVLAVVWFSAPAIVWVKNDFVASILPLRILALGLPFFFLTPLTMWSIIAKQKQIYLFYVYGIAMLVNVGLNLYFIPKQGYLAAAWITVFSEGLVLLLSGLYLRKIK